MFTWFKNIFSKKSADVTDGILIKREDLKNPLLTPNEVEYRFPDPILFKTVKVKYRNKHRKRKKK